MSLRALILLLSLCFSSQANAETERLNSFGLKACTQKNCARLFTQTATRGAPGGLFVFANARLEKYDKSGTKQVFNADDGYYDPVFDRVILRRINGTETDVMHNLKSGVTTFFN